MQNVTQNQMSQNGFQELQNELESRKNITRNQVAEEIDKARQQGDLSENSAYKSALESKEFNENRISELTDLINHAEIIKPKKNLIIGFGSKVKLKKIVDSSIVDYQIVGDKEADTSQGKISLDSPLGKLLLGKKQNDIILLNTMVGEIKYKIEAII
ncbi:MAG: transcription elongation factor GreA [bacterium]